jgi:hypothetical protein
MSTSVMAFPARVRAVLPATAEARERWVRRRVGLVWALLFLNVLTFAAGTWNQEPLIVPIPSVLGKMITQGALPVALIVALTLNRRMIIRPNVFLALVTLLAVAAIVSALRPDGHVPGTEYRTARLLGFVATLWLLSPWWGRRDLLLVRCQLWALGVALASVLLGLFVAPGRALAEGRLSGEFWPLPPTDVADLAAVLVGLVFVLWLCRLVPGRVAFAVIAVGGALLLLSHSRVALVAMLAGILVAGLSVFFTRARARWMFAGAAVIASLAITAFSGALTTWLVRGQSASQLDDLTGRTSVWGMVVRAPRDSFQILFGFGLSNKSFNGFPVDSNWLGAYLDLGLVGVVLSATLLLFVMIAAYFQPTGPRRALALFLVTYLLISSFTATGLSDASIALLELSLAASLLVPSRPLSRPG